MSNGIGRLRTMGIAAQGTFGTAETAPVFTLPLTNMPTIKPIINQVENTAALGSAYTVNEIEQTNRMAEIPVEIKIDEDQLPLYLAQRFSIASVTVSGETAVWTHTLSYATTTQLWYTLFLQDDQRIDYIVQDALFTAQTITFDNDFVRLSGSLTGTFPTVTASVANTITAPKEFVGRMVTYKQADSGSGTVAVDALTAEVNLNYGVNEEASKFKLGSQDIAVNELVGDPVYTVAVKGLESDRATYYDDYVSQQAKAVDLVSTNTDRFVTGSAANTNPSISMINPYAKITEWDEEDSNDELIPENITLTLIDKPGTSGTPTSFTIVNADDGTNYA